MKRTLILLFGITVSVMLVGCASEMPRVDSEFGTSYKLMMANQILDPDAEKNTEPVIGVSGDVGKKVTDQYYQGFEKPSAAPKYMFQIGGN
jgi:hypothetical protein